MKITHVLLRLYPRAWRERYGEEFAALLAESPTTARVVADILGGAVREHWRSVGDQDQSRASLQFQVIGFGIAGTVAACFIALFAQLAATAIYSKYGVRPEFHSVITAGLPSIAYPPSMLRSLYSLSWLPLVAMARTLLALGTSWWKWRWRLPVSGAELLVWFGGLFYVATVQQLRDLIGNGQPGIPFMSPYESWESAALSIAAASMWLMSTTPRAIAIRERIQELRNPTVPPGGTLGLSA